MFFSVHRFSPFHFLGGLLSGGLKSGGLLSGGLKSAHHPLHNN